MKRLFSVNAAAELLERDRATIVRAMRGVPADAMEHGQKRWTMAKIANSLSLHQSATSGDGARREQLRLVDEIEAGFDKIDRDFETLEAEPSIDRRKEISLKLKIGLSISNLDEQLRRANSMDKETGYLLQIACDQMVGTLRSRLLDRLNLWDQVEAIRAAGAATQ